MIDPVIMVVGFDQREAIAYHVFCQSVLERASQPVHFVPLTANSIPGYRETHKDGSNAFTYSRFLVPYLLNYTGWAIFVDGDMVCRDDIVNLWKLRDATKAVQVAKHSYVTKSNQKYLGNKNENYPMKNWSSVILWNCGHPSNRQLTPEVVGSKNGSFLHRFQWLSDDEIGEISRLWNWLAIEYEPSADAKLVHYTLGTPCFNEYKNSDMAEDWHLALARAKQGLE
jgi:hypothetical protein